MSEIFKDGLEGFQELPVTEEEAGFHVNDDGAAEWCIGKIREEKAELEKWETFYKGQIEKMRRKAEDRIAFFEGKLAMYFGSVPHKVTKTQESYQLPGGKLVVKKQAPEIQHDDEKILDWLHENSKMPETYIDFRETLKWGELKKVLTVAGEGMATQDGEMIPGITVTERPDVFKVEVK